MYRWFDEENQDGLFYIEFDCFEMDDMDSIFMGYESKLVGKHWKTKFGEE